MGKINRSLTFNKKFLSKLVSDQTACVQVYKKTYHLGLHPFHLTNLNSSIKEILNGKIAKFDKTFDGILLGYRNIKLLDSAGAINFDNCFIHTNIEADFYIFKPIVSQILNGVVNKKSKDHVGCLVHKTFNISLPKPENSEEWIGSSAEIGQEIQFEIIFTDLDGKLPYIKGKILSIPSEDSGISTSEEANYQENSITNFDQNDIEIPSDLVRKKKRKRKNSRSSSETEIKTNKSEDFNYNNDKYEHGKHKHKHKKEKEMDEIILERASNNKELVTSINTIKVKKEHKKRKKNKMNNEGDSSTNEKQYGHSFPVSLEGEMAASNSHSDIIKTKKKEKQKYSQEVNELDNTIDNLNTEENLEKKHKKKKHKHKKESTENEVFLKYESKRHSEEVVSDTRNEIRTHVKKKKKTF